MVIKKIHRLTEQGKKVLEVMGIDTSTKPKVFDAWRNNSNPCPRCNNTHKEHWHGDGVTKCPDGTIISYKYPYNQCRAIVESEHEKIVEELKLDVNGLGTELGKSIDEFRIYVISLKEKIEKMKIEAVDTSEARAFRDVLKLLEKA